MNTDSLRELAASMALAVCQINALQPLAADLPPVSLDSYESKGAFDLHGYVHGGYTDPNGTYVSLSAEDQIDAVRTWARALGSDLLLTKVREDGTSEHLNLETRAVLDNGLKVRIVANLYYQRQAGAPTSVAALPA
jgi:hypothetical protein